MPNSPISIVLNPQPVATSGATALREKPVTAKPSSANLLATWRPRKLVAAVTQALGPSSRGSMLKIS
jgi:hypothetical protein